MFSSLSNLQYAVVIVSCISCCVWSDPLLSGCTHNGQTYKSGEFYNPTLCEHCECYDGRASCNFIACSFTPCVDAVVDPTKCCPQCPNGRNCRAPDGSIVKEGETYKPDDNTMCQCPVNVWGLQGNEALCAYRMTTPKPLQVVS